MRPNNELLRQAIDAAIEGGQAIMTIYNDPAFDAQVSIKSDNSPVTIADKRAHEVIAKALAKPAKGWKTVFPMMSEVFQSTDVLFYHAIVAARNSGMAQKGDSIVITGGLPNGKSGNTNLIKLETL